MWPPLISCCGFQCLDHPQCLLHLYKKLVTWKRVLLVHLSDNNEPRSSYVASRGTTDVYNRPIAVEIYSLEEERLRSFVGWPLNESVHPEQLARVGFVYTGEGSLVQCFQCGVRYRNWLKGDIPLSVHQRCNPHCAFLRTLSCQHKQSSKQKSSMLTVNDLCDVPVLNFPDYSYQATRLQSFKYWGGVLPKEELAEAGFYMIARRDVVRCFSCHVVLQDWEKTDNVIDEHRRHNPECTFLKKYLPSMLNSSYVSKLVCRGQIDTRVTSFSRLSIRIPQSAKVSVEPSPPRSGDEAQGMHYSPMWPSNAPATLLGAKENAWSQKRVDYSNTLTRLHPLVDTTPKQIVVS